MDAERFLDLIGAYGADRRRWPLCERDGARAFAEANAEICAAWLNAEAALDHALDTAPSVQAYAELRERIVNGAPQSRTRSVAPRRWFWAPGAGLAAACAAGALFGILVTDRLTASSRADGVLALSSAITLSEASELTGTPNGR